LARACRRNREAAVKLYTREAAYLAWDENKKGSLEVGKFADMIVLDHDVMTVPPELLLTDAQAVLLKEHQGAAC
jgi:predicted amidohydrolase YtcJ